MNFIKEIDYTSISLDVAKAMHFKDRQMIRVNGSFEISSKEDTQNLIQSCVSLKAVGVSLCIAEDYSEAKAR